MRPPADRHGDRGAARFPAATSIGGAAGRNSCHLDRVHSSPALSWGPSGAAPGSLMLNVLHVIPAVAPRYGGPSQAVVDMCRALRHSDVATLIATTDADGAGRLAVRHGQPVSWQGLPAIFFAREWSESFKYSGALACWLGASVRRFDVVHIHAVFSHASVAAAKACRRHGVPYIVRPLGTLSPWSLAQKSAKKRLLWHLGVRDILRHAAALHYTTAEERRLAERTLGLRRGAVIPLGVSDDLLGSEPVPNPLASQLPFLGGSPYVLFLSRLHPKKGLELLVDAFLRVTEADHLRHWRLVIAGDGDPAYVLGLRRYVASRQSAHGRDGIMFSGWLEGAAKTAALAGAALFALPSQDENFGIAVAEAMACGTPVLVSQNVNLSAEVLSGHAGWVVSLEPEDLRHALRQALASSEGRTQRGAAGRELAASQFRWATIAESLRALYLEVR